MTQEERLARREALRAEIATLETAVRALLQEEQALLKECTHTYASGQSALVGGRIKVCVHCAQIVPPKDEKLWG